MTRLQSRASPCECGKTKKVTESFVNKPKFYETRSSDRKSRNFFSARRRTFISDERTVHRKLCINKISPQTKMPIKERSTLSNGDFKKARKHSTETCGKMITTSENARSLKDNKLDELIAKNMKVGIIESDCLKSSITISEELFSSNGNGVVSDKEVLDRFQNGVDIITVNQFTCENGYSTLIKKENGNCEPANFKVLGDYEPTIHEQNIESEEGLTETEISGYSVVNKKRKKRKSKFQSLLEATSEMKICSLAEKRSRKRPENFSPPLTKRKIKIEDASNSADEAKKKSNYTLSGRLKKKCGRKPKPKGPVLHYLDLYEMQKKSGLNLVNDTVYDDNKSCDYYLHTDSKNDDTPTDVYMDSNACNISPKDTSDVEASDKRLDNPLNASTYHNSRKYSDDDCHHYKKNQLLKSKTNKTKQLIKEKNTKFFSKEFDKKIIQVLGYRKFQTKSELLVLFENGTSNWIDEEIEGTTIFDKLELFYDHNDHEQSVLNRISYNVIQEIKQNQCDVGTSVDDVEIKSSSESDCDVFLNVINSTEKSCLPSFPILPKTHETHEVPLKVNTEIPVQEETLVDGISQNEMDRTLQNEINKNSNVTLKLAHVCDSGEKEILSSSDLNELCNYVMSSSHIKFYPYETTKEIVYKTDGEFVHIYLKRISKRHIGKKTDDPLNLTTCETLINILEDCAINDHCNLVVISGVEDYFAFNGFFDKLLKNSPSSEGKKYEQDILVLRYLVQTIKNFNKPIAAIIKRTATGLPASMLSLFDMVFDQKMTNGLSSKPSRTSSKRLSRSNSNTKSPLTPSKSTKCNSTDDNTTDEQDAFDSFQNFVFPRLMGLSDRNEAQIMGENQNLQCKSFDDDGLLENAYCTKTLSQPLRNSVRHMKINSKIHLKCRDRNRSGNWEPESNVQEVSEPGQISRQCSATSSVEMEGLEEKVKLEREQVQKCMEDLASYLKQLQSNSF